jgi:hypothetical protein
MVSEFKCNVAISDKIDVKLFLGNVANGAVNNYKLDYNPSLHLLYKKTVTSIHSNYTRAFLSDIFFFSRKARCLEV